MLMLEPLGVKALKKFNLANWARVKNQLHKNCYSYNYQE